MYKNADYDQKYYFAYITGIRYINDEMTEISIKTDVFQTWQFDFVYKKSFVERKHVTDDVAGKYTIAEPVATGEYVMNNFDYYSDLDEYFYVLQVTKFLPPYDTTLDQKGATNFGGVPMTGGAYLIDNIQNMQDMIYAYNHTNGYSIDMVYNAYLIPKICFDPNSYGTAPLYHLYQGQDYPMVYHYNIDKANALDTYTPRNKKLLTFPYCYMLLSNNNGSQNILHYEKFKGSDCAFNISCVPTVGGSIKCTPEEYSTNQSYNEEEGILLGKYPLINYNKDNYASWLLTNSASLATQRVQGMATMGIGGLTAITALGTLLTASSLTALTTAGLVGGAIGGLGTLLGGAFQIQNSLNEDYQHSLVPNSASSLSNGGDINVCQDMAGFFFYRYSIKREFAEIIDSYFDMFGYKVNSMEVPNLHTRTNWNYLKIISPNVESTDVPDTDLNEYKQMLTTGITFWHNINTFRDYSQSNPVIV